MLGLPVVMCGQDSGEVHLLRVDRLLNQLGLHGVDDGRLVGELVDNLEEKSVEMVRGTLTPESSLWAEGSLTKYM